MEDLLWGFRRLCDCSRSWFPWLKFCERLAILSALSEASVRRCWSSNNCCGCQFPAFLTLVIRIMTMLHSSVWSGSKATYVVLGRLGRRLFSRQGIGMPLVVEVLLPVPCVRGRAGPGSVFADLLPACSRRSHLRPPDRLFAAASSVRICRRFWKSDPPIL